MSEKCVICGKTFELTEQTDRFPPICDACLNKLHVVHVAEQSKPETGKRRGPLPEFKDEHASLMRVRKAAADLCEALTINTAGELVAPCEATRKLERALEVHRREFGGA